MKKQIRAIIIATIVTCVILISCACAIPAQAERPEFYPKLTVVVDSIRIDSHLWVVDCRDKDGNIWSFFDDEGTWARGDIANLLMMTINENEEEDELVEIYWEGFTEYPDEYFMVIGWK